MPCVTIPGCIVCEEPIFEGYVARLSVPCCMRCQSSLAALRKDKARYEYAKKHPMALSTSHVDSIDGFIDAAMEAEDV